MADVYEKIVFGIGICCFIFLMIFLASHQWREEDRACQSIGFEKAKQFTEYQRGCVDENGNIQFVDFSYCGLLQQNVCSVRKITVGDVGWRG